MRANSCLRHLLSLALALCMVLALSLSAFAVEGHPESGNASVQNDKQGVLQVRLGFKIKDSNNVQEIQAGTGFLINPDYMVTCYHVVNFDMLKDEDWKTIKDEYGMSRKQVEDKKQISVSVYRDMSIKATIVHQSAKVDLAILKLDQPLQSIQDYVDVILKRKPMQLHLPAALPPWTKEITPDLPALWLGEQGENTGIDVMEMLLS